MTVMTLTTHATPSFTSDTAGSWNPKVPCTSPLIVRISDITDNMTGAASFSNSIFSPGITSPKGEAKRWLTPGSTPPGWVSPGPPCTITNSKGQTVAAFVEIRGVGRDFWSYEDCQTSYDAVNGGTAFTSGKWCDSTGNLFDPAMVPTYAGSCTSPSDRTCWGRIHAEFDGNWFAAGYCGTGVCNNNTLVQSTIAGSSSSLIDVQGYIFWDPDHTNTNYHSFSGWELHPLTAWRPHNSTSPPGSTGDFSISANPASLTVPLGSSATSMITVGSLNGFSGPVNLSVSVSSNGLSVSPPSTSLNPTTLTVATSGTATATMTVSVSLLTTLGSYTATITGKGGGITHTTTVTITVPATL